MSIVEFGGSPSWSLDVSELGRVQNERSAKVSRFWLRDLEQSDIYHYLTTFWEPLLLDNRILKAFLFDTFFLLNSASIWIRET